MDAKELRLVWEAAMGHKNFEQFVRNVQHIISYLESEQKKRESLEMKLEHNTRVTEENTTIINKNEKDLLEVRLTQRMILENSEKNSKMIRSVLVAVVIAIIVSLLKLK